MEQEVKYGDALDKFLLALEYRHILRNSAR